MVLTKVQCFMIFKHFSTCYNAHIIFIYKFCSLIFTIKGSAILSNWFPYSSNLLINIRLKLLSLLVKIAPYFKYECCYLTHSRKGNILLWLRLLIYLHI